jgi:hypothetical protein
MGLWLKQSTAVDVIVGPFIDDGDGKTAETGLTVTQAEVRLSKNGGNMAQKNEATSLVHDELGYYDCNLDATDTNTLGRLQLMVHESGALPVYHEYMVVTANVYDTLCGTDLFQSDLTQIGGVAQSATDLKDFADAGYDPATNKVQGVVLTDLATACTTVTTTTNVTNDVGITQAGADKAWATAARALTDKAGFSLAADQSAVTVGTVTLVTTTTDVTNDVGITQAGADKAWATAARALTDKAGFSLVADQSAVTVGTVNTALALTANNDKTGYALTAAGIDSIIDEVIEGTITLRQATRFFLAALVGKSSGGGTATIVFRDTGDATDRITATVTADGNRTAMVLDPT